MKEALFTWDNWKLLFVELLKMYSHKPSLFSKKRFHEGIAYGVLVHGWLYSLVEYVADIASFAVWVGTIMPFIFYNLYKTQKEKLNGQQGSGNSQEN